MGRSPLRRGQGGHFRPAGTQARILEKEKGLERDLAPGPCLVAGAVSLDRESTILVTRKRVVATASRREGVYNRAGEPSVPFCGKGGARERADDFFFSEGKKEVGAKWTLLRRGAADGT